MIPTKTVPVDLGSRSYPIHIGQDLLTQAELLTPHIKGNQIAIVTNTTIAPLYLEILQKNLASYNVITITLPDGEQHKNLTTLNTIFDDLLANKHNRTTTLIALGGGVMGDMTGFAASAYQRGVNFIQIPTTLLSQVDSSVGGKTGVNHALGKNMIGAFYQPQCVLIDINTLNTLPTRELSAGLAEVIKYGLIFDADFFVWLENNIDHLLARDAQALSYAIARSCQIKAEIVSQDETESGIRAILNLGHTFGHAIETAQGYGNWLHGEAVAAGMVMAAELSQREGFITANDVERTRHLIERAHLPTQPPTNMLRQQWLDLMSVDKKVLNGQLRLILLNRIGSARATQQFNTDNLLAVLPTHT